MQLFDKLRKELELLQLSQQQNEELDVVFTKHPQQICNKTATLTATVMIPDLNKCCFSLSCMKVNSKSLGLGCYLEKTSNLMIPSILRPTFGEGKTKPKKVTVSNLDL